MQVHHSKPAHQYRAPVNCASAELIIGVVLAGGRSSRMGCDKAILDWRGISLLEHMYRLLYETVHGRVIVSGGKRAGYECIPDAELGRGPGLALSHVLAELPENATALIVPIDMPLLTPTLLRKLLAYPAACFADHPLPAVLPTRTQDGGKLEGNSVKSLHRAVGSVMLSATPHDKTLLVNANTPEEWQGMKIESA